MKLTTLYELRLETLTREQTRRAKRLLEEVLVPYIIDVYGPEDERFDACIVVEHLTKADYERALKALGL